MLRQYKVVGVAMANENSDDWDTNLEDEEIYVSIDDDDYIEEVCRFVPNWSSPDPSDFHEIIEEDFDEDRLFSDAYDKADEILKSMYIDFDFGIERRA